MRRRAYRRSAGRRLAPTLGLGGRRSAVRDQVFAGMPGCDLRSGRGAEMPPWCDFFWPNRRPAAILGTCKKVLAIALCCASACPDGAGAAPKHPLDPLAAEELLVIRDVLASSGRFSPN